MPSSTHFTAGDIPSLTGLTALVTGGNGGIGLETVKQLSLHGAKVYMASRSPEKGEKAIKELKEQNAGKELDLHFVRVDLSDLQSVRDGAREVASKEQKLDILVCNAGLMACPYELTKDGVETQFQTNYLGHFVLSEELLPLLEAGHKARATQDASSIPASRIVLLSSIAHKMISSNPFQSPKFSDLSTVNRKLGLIEQSATWMRYSQAKLCAILHARQINARYAAKGVHAIAVHPGVIDSELWKYTPGRSVLKKYVLQPVEDGALSPLYGATSPEVEKEGSWDVYRAEFGQKSSQTKLSQDDKLGGQLWNLSVKLMEEKTK